MRGAGVCERRREGEGCWCVCVGMRASVRCAGVCERERCASVCECVRGAGVCVMGRECEVCLSVCVRGSVRVYLPYSG